jgi:acetaldehyde dehydrogenase/alcohol dehydrogenase
VFAEVPIEPDEQVIKAGVELLDRVQPDAIVAVGGGSVIDAAKVMRLLHEHPECSLHDLSLPFLDARKRVADYPQDPHRVKLVAIPTTSGTGSEVSPAAVISSGGRKVSLVDYTLVPDIAIVDPNLTLTMPPVLTADTGIDALTHALEAGVSIFATPYTDAFCVQAARLIFDALPKAFADGSDLAAREAMANASTIAGLAFANAFVGVNHALAHAVGARFGLSHGRVNGVFLPHVMRYNAALPTKFMPAPGYGAYIAPEKYATLGLVLFGGRGPEEQRRRLFTHVDELLVTVGIPRTLREAGIAEEEFEAAIPDLLRLAFEDPSIRTNPRMPLLNELESLLRAAYGAEPSRR